MEIKIVDHEKNVLEFEILGVDRTLPELLTGRLSETSGIEFVSYKVDHPLVGKPRIIVKTKSQDALEVTLKALEAIKDDVSELKKALKKSK